MENTGGFVLYFHLFLYFFICLFFNITVGEVQVAFSDFELLKGKIAKDNKENDKTYWIG